MKKDYEAMSDLEQFRELTRLVKVFNKCTWNNAVRQNGDNIKSLVTSMMDRKLGKHEEVETVKLFD